MNDVVSAPCRVLVVDDDPIVLRALTRTVQRMGYEVVAEKDPDLALGILQEQDFEVILADLNLPMASRDGLFAVHARQAKPGVPLLVVTGEDDPQRIEAMLTGASIQGVLRKPARPSVLARALDEAVSPDGPPSGLPEAV